MTTERHDMPHCHDTSPAPMVAAAQAAAIAPLRDRAPFLKHWIVLDGSEREGWLEYDPLLAAAVPDEPPVVAGPEDIHNVLFTSGTTGRPKGAMISQRAAAIRGLR